MKKRKEKEVNLKKCCLYLLLVYMIAVFVFYFAAGEQLFVRDSKNNINSIIGEGAMAELLQGESYSQEFPIKMDYLTGLRIQLSTFARQNTGSVFVRLFDVENKILLFKQEIDTLPLQDSVYTYLKIEPPIEGMRDKKLLIEFTSPTGTPGNAVAPWYHSQAAEEGWQLYVNGEAAPGVLCFDAYGMDKVWTGPHYWQLAALGGVIILLYCIVMLYQEKKGRKGFVFNAILALSKYRFLIEQLVARDFKTKYKRSVLGVLWSFLNPLLTMIVQYIVFSTIFKADVKNYPVYLLTGIVLFSFFSEAVGMSLMSILGNASLITKVYVPKYIYPVTRVLSSTVNLLISLLPLMVMILFTKTQVTTAYILLIFPLACLVLFCVGMGFLLSSSMVFFRDTQFLWNVFSLLWMYATPIFYPESILPPEFGVVHQINPMYHFIRFARIIVIDGISPEPRMYVQCAAFALGFLAVGAFVFKKAQDKFVFYI